MDLFFALLREAFAKHKFEANVVYNLDESGITMVQSVPKVIAEKGTKKVGHITAQERGTLVTVCCCANASGQALPPAMIFPRVNFKDYMREGAPASTLGLATATGWMNAELFLQVLAHFIKHIGCSKEKPALLLMDNHDNNCSFEVMDLARDNGLTIVTFPPHSSHRLQPLDVSVYGPLKKHYSAAVNEWNLSHPGRRITIYDLPACFARSFYKAFSYDNIVQGFKSAGVFPLNSDIFTEEDFLPSTVFKPPQPPANLANRSITYEEEHIPEDTLQQPDGAEACCLPTPMTLASGGSPMFPLVIHQPASPSIWPAVQSLRRGLSTNPGATMWRICG